MKYMTYNSKYEAILGGVGMEECSLDLIFLKIRDMSFVFLVGLFFPTALYTIFLDKGKTCIFVTIKYL